MGARGSRVRRGRPRKEEARDTRRLILDKALELFAGKGFAATSVRQIARAVGVTEGAIYAHFGGKREIFEAIFEEAGPPVVVEILDSLEQELVEPEAFVRRLVRKILDAWDEKCSRLATSVYVREGGLEGVLGFGGEGLNLLSAIEEVQRRVGGLFGRWTDEGLLETEALPEQLAWELLAPIAYVRLFYLHGQATEGDRSKGRTLAERHVEYFLSCVLTDGKGQLLGGRSNAG